MGTGDDAGAVYVPTTTRDTMIRLLALLLLALAASPASAAMATVEPAFGASYVAGFIDFWSNWFKNRNSVLFSVLIVGAIAIFIITRGKKLK